MSNIRRTFLLAVMQLFDILVICVAFLLGASAYSELSGFTLEEFLALRVKVFNVFLFIVLLLLCHISLRLQGLYQSQRLSKRFHEILAILKAVSLNTVGISLAAVLFQIEMVTAVSLAVFWLTSSFILIVSRLVLRQTLARIREKGRNLRHVVIVGTNPRAVQFARKIDSRPELGYHLLGFADDRWAGIPVFQRTGYGVVTNLTSLSNFLRETVVDEVIIGLPLKSNYQRVHEIVRTCETLGICVRLLCGIFDLKVARSRAELFEDETVVSVYTGRMEGWPVIVKRAVDLLVSTVLLGLLLPAFLIVAVLIKLTSPGPVFFVQERVGLSKRRFRLYKFRTMMRDAEQRMSIVEELNEIPGPVFKIKNDPRVTQIGRFLRRTSIDELPQLINVLKGDMSLVGPRPLPVRDYNGFDRDAHLRRFSVRPGITCLWQINGRSEVPFEKWMELDIQYIDRWSLWLDFKILLKTIPVVLKGTGAA